MQAALEALSNIAPGDVVVTKVSDTSTSQVWQIAFAGTLADTNVSQTTIDSTNVTVMGMKSNVQTTVTAGGTVTYEVQTTSLLNANGGTYTLSFQDQTTGPLAWNASAATIDTALEGLSTIDTVNVSGSSGCFSITFTGTHSGENVPQLAGDDSLLENHQNRVLSFEYDAADQLTAAEDPAAEYAYVYDNLGRVTQQTQTIAGLTPSIVFNQKFDAASNRTELAATIGGTADFKNTYAYDNLNRMTQVIQQANGGNAVAAKRVDFAYNAAGQFDTVTRYADAAGTQEVAKTLHAYDGMGRLTALDHKKGANFLAAYDYTYDAASRITSIDSLTDGLSTFTYDVTNQLTDADHASQPDEDYSFDLNGNRTMTGHVVGTNNRISTDGTYNFTYDNEGNRTSQTKISTGEVTEYEWDHRNRLTKVTQKNSGGAVVKTTEHSYDVYDRWVRRRVDPDGAGAAAAVDAFFAHDGDQIALVFDGATASNLDNRLLWGPNVDQLLADEDVSTLTSAGDVTWALTDHLGTPRDLAQYNSGTDTTTVVNHRIYEAFGALVSQSNGSFSILIGFTGRPYDDSTGLQNNWHRWYVSTSGVWLSEDPIGFEGGDANLRRYVENSPVYVLDPSGLAPPNGGVVNPGETLEERIERRQREVAEDVMNGKPLALWKVQKLIPKTGIDRLDKIVDEQNSILERKRFYNPIPKQVQGTPIISLPWAPCDATYNDPNQWASWEDVLDAAGELLVDLTLTFGGAVAAGPADDVARGGFGARRGVGAKSGAANGSGVRPQRPTGQRPVTPGEPSPVQPPEGQTPPAPAPSEPRPAAPAPSAANGGSAAGAGTGNAARIVGGPFKDFPEWGKSTVKWGTGAKDAAARAAKITAEEAKALDPAKVRAAKEFYECIYRESLKGNPNAAAKARAELMGRILDLQEGK